MQDRISVTYYTDPFCAWSFAAESAMDRFRYEWMNRADFICRMLPVVDRLNTEPNPKERIHNPEEMAEEWRNISAITGVAIDPNLWREDPPQSTWPACIAIKAADRQGVASCAQFLRLLRVHIMQRRRNGSRREVLTEVAEESGLDLNRFLYDLTDKRDELEREVVEDIRDAKANCVDHTPALLIENHIDDKVLIVGPRDYSLYRQAAETLLSEQRDHSERLARLGSGNREWL